jgi:predicted Zn-dependent protease with MMP-like domain
MLRMSREMFEQVVADALDGLPDEIGAALENIAVTVEDEPEPELLESMGMEPEEDTLFGLYQGTSLPDRALDGYSGHLPDKIVVYRIPLLEACETRRELIREIRDTVVHEIGHYFGLDEEDLP